MRLARHEDGGASAKTQLRRRGGGGRMPRSTQGGSTAEVRGERKVGIVARSKRPDIGCRGLDTAKNRISPESRQRKPGITQGRVAGSCRSCTTSLPITGTRTLAPGCGGRACRTRTPTPGISLRNGKSPRVQEERKGLWKVNYTRSRLLAQIPSSNAGSGSVASGDLAKRSDGSSDGTCIPGLTNRIHQPRRGLLVCDVEIPNLLREGRCW